MHANEPYEVDRLRKDDEEMTQLELSIERICLWNIRLRLCYHRSLLE